MAVRIEATELKFPVRVLQGGSIFWVCGLNLKSVKIKMKASTEQYFPGILFIILQKVILTLESVDETPKCDHSNENY